MSRCQDLRETELELKLPAGQGVNQPHSNPQTPPSTALLTERPRSFTLRISDQTTDSLARAVATLSATHLITHNVWCRPQNLLVLSDTVSAMGLAREAGHVLLSHNRLPRACIIVRNTADAEDGWG